MKHIYSFSNIKSIKKVLFALLFIIVVFFTVFDTAKAQPLGNEWIDYDQAYFKIKVSKEGIYRISYNTLVAAGVPVGTFDPRSLQLFNKGEEQYIYVHNENTGVFTANDYIEFYANKNDGWFDAAMFNSPGTHTNPYYSLINDTAVYFLTWNNILSNRRVALFMDSNFSPYVPIPYFYAVNHQNYTDTYFYGETNLFGGTDAEYTIGEGWFDNGVTIGGTTTKTLQTPNFLSTGPDATLTMALVGASLPMHHLRITLPGEVFDTTYVGYKNFTFNRQIPASLLSSSGSQFVFSSIDDQGSSADRNTVAYISLKYPQTLNLNNASTYRMYVPDGTQNNAYLYLSNFNVGVNDSVILYDVTNHKKVKVVRNGNMLQALVPNSGGEKFCYISSSAQIVNVTDIQPVNTDMGNYAKFTDYSDAAYTNSDYLIVTHATMAAEAINYKNYRQSTGYNVLMVYADELYDQFAYGIAKHPLSIRNFARFAMNTFTGTPKALFLIGKSYNAVSYRKNTAFYAGTLVPTFGVPASDNLFTSRIIDTLYQPAIPTGRLVAQNNTHVSIYLNKVIAYEQAQQLAQQTPELWMKNVLHFGGGTSLTEQSQISTYLGNYKEIIEDTLFGGYVRTFLKTSSAPIQINQSDSLKEIINNGVSLMTFFGHASGTGFDQSIDNPSEYNNTGKYPFLFANSCFAGDIFSSSLSSSEAFVLIQDKGVIGYLASTAPSPVGSLNTYASWFYKNISILNYGKPIGTCIQQTINNVQATAPGNPYVKEVCLVTVLHGDPAIKLNAFEKPDFEVTASSIYYDPAYVTTGLDSFEVNVIAVNKGRALSGNYIVELKRTYPDGSMTDTYLKQIPATAYKDTLTFKLPVDKVNGVGVNVIKVTLDLYNDYDEITKVNNTVTVSLLIKSLDIIPVYPPRYAIIPNANSVVLKASSGDPFLGVKNYIFQIDTTDNFNSPSLTIHQTSGAGGVITWTLPPTFVLTDSTVYYWRVALDETQPVWRESSFQYIFGKRGWGQSHYFQFKDDAYEYVNFNRADRDFVFVNNYKSLVVQAGVYPYLAWDEQWFKINGSVMDIWSCLSDVGNGMKLAVFNPISGEPWYSTDVGQNTGPYGNAHCHDYPVPAFDFFTYYPPNSAGFRQKITDFINLVPAGFYVLAYNHRNHYAQEFEEPLRVAFESIGSSQIRYIQNNTPYIIFGRKGMSIGLANEATGSTQQSVITLVDSIKTAWNQGYIKSELIGPSTHWNSLHWRYNYKDGMPTDSVRLSVIGIKLNGQQDTLLYGISEDSLDIFNLDTIIPAAEYPYMHLIAYMRDDSMHTPAQMNRWQVLYEGVPETSLNPSAQFYFHSDTLQQGEDLVFSCAIQNIGDYNMDSLLVSYWVVDKDRNIIPVSYPRQRPHPVGDVFIDTVTFSTKYLSGLNSFWVEVNPHFDQLEQYSINNIGEVPFYVATDKTNPLLEVTFDGVHILDGDIVSANPEIEVLLRDENKFLAVDDTSLFRVFLKKPGMSDAERVYFVQNGVEMIRFFPAAVPENICRLKYAPGLLPDGVYELKVQAKDVSQNVSGTYDYNIRFEVVNKSTITEVLNYPNPFSTSTRFVFTLTGAELPTYMKIQIMTISGKIVKEIDMSELGTLHIGRNITEYAWDGRDEFGDRLANGVYLYRVIAKMNDQKIELNPTTASKYFKQEFGKMFLFR